MRVHQIRKAPEWIMILLSAVLCCPMTVKSDAVANPVGATWDIGRIASGQSLYTSLQEKQMPPRSIQHIVRGLKPHISFSKIPPDTAYRYVLDPGGEIEEFAIEAGHKLFYMTVKEGGYVVKRWKVARSTTIATVRGTLDTSLTEAFQKAGEAGDLSRHFEEILALSTDPVIEMNKGDHFRLVVEKIQSGDWLLRYGRIEAFELQRGDASFLAIRFKDGFYNETGTSLKRQFLQVPLHYQFVSSEFMKKRRHPILGGVRPHRGIDFAAPVGTPVWAVADGQIIAARWMNGFGRTVVVRHDHGYESLYAHLQEYGTGIHVGALVTQKEVIGFIGTSGLSTGPHLHYGLTRDGEDRDPLKEQFPRETITAQEDLQAFLAKKEAIAAILSADDLVAAKDKTALADASVQCP